MKIIISPAKKMEVCDEFFEPGGLPEYLEKTKLLYGMLKEMDEPGLKALFKANDKITHENWLRFQSMELECARTPALLSYVGIQYQYMSPKLFSCSQWEYVKKNLRILSGFYGILRPDDRVTPYRLEMQAKLACQNAKDLYEFWGGLLYESLYREEPKPGIILNLASKEYSRAVEPYGRPGIRFVNCIFGTAVEGKIRVKATEAKMARGEMVRYMAEHEVESIEELRGFSALGYRLDERRSDESCLVYVKEAAALQADNEITLPD